MADVMPLARARRPGVVRRAFAGAWHVPAGFAFLLRRPGLWPLAALPTVLAMLLMAAGAILAVFLVPDAERAVAPAPGRAPSWLELPISLLLTVATIGGGVFLGLGIALLLSAPLLDLLSRRVERRARGSVPEPGRGVGWETAQALRGAVYFLIAAPGVFALGLIPVLGPFLSVLWGARAVAFQMTDPALSRRGLAFAEKRRWHHEWLPESEGFGLAGMIGMLVPFANLLLGPALVTGGTLLVLEIDELAEQLGGRVDAAPPEPAQAAATG
ncbi:MAG TPA: EI24 domain-containing protein [Vicinamibacteria bacterium]|nr:EI24 domain-containing protein [Vicinamibacteria bacterium]